jgi:hypothetical protein
MLTHDLRWKNTSRFRSRIKPYEAPITPIDEFLATKDFEALGFTPLFDDENQTRIRPEFGSKQTFSAS